jgi:CDP-6-deoxy-D-xylo-4-hexulose-3-dehydrase
MNDISAAIKTLAAMAHPKYLHGMKEFVPGKTLIPYSGPFWNEREIELALDAFLNGSWLTTGTNVFKFQNLFAKKFGVRHAHMVNSGSSANLVLITALKKHLKWQDGDEIIVSPVGFPTTIAPIAQNNLKPVFVDIEWTTLNFDLKLVRKAITPRTRAIFVSPVLGNPPDIDELCRIVADNPHVKLIGDNCDSLGSRWDNELITHVYTAWTTSFYPAHHITTGEGGMVCSNDEELMKTARSISWWGRACYCVGQANLLACGTCGKRFSKWLEDEGVDATIDHKYVFENMGYNLKPLDLQGAIGIAQLEKWGTIESKRRENFTRIRQIIEEIPGLRVAGKHALADPSWFGVPIVATTSKIKETVVNYFEKNKIQTRSYFAGNILSHPGYKHLGVASDYPNAQEALTHVFFLGCPPFYTDDIINYIGEKARGLTGW